MLTIILSGWCLLNISDVVTMVVLDEVSAAMLPVLLVSAVYTCLFQGRSGLWLHRISNGLIYIVMDDAVSLFGCQLGVS